MGAVVGAENGYAIQAEVGSIIDVVVGAAECCAVRAIVGAHKGAAETGAIVGAVRVVKAEDGCTVRVAVVWFP